MIKKVISGGQTGADIAGLRAAAALKIPTGGWMPKGFKTEAGPRPWIAERYDLKEHNSSNYLFRTSQNIKEADMTLILAYTMTGGSAKTRDMCFHYKRHVFHINQSDMLDLQSLKEVVAWVKSRKHDVINIAGNRESKARGIEKIGKAFLIRLFEAVNAR